MRPDSRQHGREPDTRNARIGVARLRCNVVEGIIEHLRGPLQKTRVHLHSENANSLTECSTGAKPAAREATKLDARRTAPTDAASATQLGAQRTEPADTTQLGRGRPTRWRRPSTSRPYSAR